MNPESKKKVATYLAIAAIGGCIAVAFLRSSDSEKVGDHKESPRRASENNPVQPPEGKGVLSNVEEIPAAINRPPDPKVDPPSRSAAEEDFWRPESPDRSKIIAFNNLSQKFELTDKTKKTTSIPNWIRVDGTDYEIVEWAWKDDDTLLAPGWSDLNEEHGDVEYARRDVGDAKLFVYRYGVSEKPEVVPLPSIAPGKCIRLEGFSKNGQVILAEVFPYSYKSYGRIMDGEKLIGAFDIIAR